jgi:hypothetical protein
MRPLSPDIQSKDLVTWENPSGAITITNSDFELTGTIAHQDILACEVDVTVHTLLTFTDNKSVESWANKRSSTSRAAHAYLLRMKALHHQRHFGYKSDTNYISGPANCMADECSRWWYFTTHNCYLILLLPIPRVNCGRCTT